MGMNAQVSREEDSRTNATITFPRSQILLFYKNRKYPTTRPLGIDFLEYIGVTVEQQQDDANRCFLLMLLNSPSDIAGRLIIKHTDWRS
jgi:hypothetical protein